ncbi:hypothetical protein BYT27DRAFT_7232467 [Phlegmacium glaucopus]|nr:hypothetical protein BYT27DRAFT_7232467 [Phlegmacium glaucopus]
MSDSDEFGGLGTTTPYVSRTKPFISEKANSRVPTSAEAGPSNPTRAQLLASGKQVHEIDDNEDDEDDVEVRNVRGNGKRKETHVVEDEDDDEIQEVDPPPPKTTRSRGGSRKPTSTVNGKPTATTAVAKGKARAGPKIGPPRSAPKSAREPMDVDLNDAVEHGMDVDVNGAALIANTLNTATVHNAGRAPKFQSGQKNDDGTTARLEEQLRQALSRIDSLTARFNELCQIRNTEPELLLERMEGQFKMQLQAQETLIANLNAQLARKDPVHRTHQQVFEILTREEANREMHALQAEVNEWKKRYQNVEKKLKEKDDEISTLKQSRSYISLLSLWLLSGIEHFFILSENDLRIELQAEIDRGKTMANKLQRMPPSTSRPRTGNGLSSTDDPKLAEIIKFYEDLTNLIVPSMKLGKGKYLDTDEWILNCVYSYTDEVAQKDKGQSDSRTISFTLRLCKEPPTASKEPVESERQLVETVQYVPQNLDKESAAFRESLEFLNTTFTFERSQLSLFIRTLRDRMSGDGESDDSRSEDDVQIVEVH